MRKFLIILFSVCALQSGAQTLTATYVQLADSADYYIRYQRWDDAERMITAALRHEPANPSNYLLWNNLGIVRDRQDNFTGAIEAFNIGLAGAPRSTTLLSGRAGSYLNLGNIDDALADLNTALSIDSTLLWPRKMRGILLASKGKPDDALRDLDRYIAASTTDAAALETHADIDMQRGYPDKALPYYESAADAEPSEEIAVKMLSAALAAGKIEDYADKLAEAIKRYPHCGELYLIRGLWNKSRYQNASAAQDAALAAKCGIDKSRIESLLGKTK